MRTRLAAPLALIVLGCTSATYGQNQSGAPPAAVELWSFLIGDWTIEGRVGNNDVTGTSSHRWAASKHCYVGTQVWNVGNNVIHLKSLGGWDPVEQQYVEYGFGSSGSTATVRYNVSSPSGQKGVTEGKITGHTRRIGAWTADVTLHRKGPDEYTLTTTTPNGDTMHALTYRRKSK